eukprot:scaffold6432_cov153-Pinguiococcus_pyrenoidosus.AAC.1
MSGAQASHGERPAKAQKRRDTAFVRVAAYLGASAWSEADTESLFEAARKGELVSERQLLALAGNYSGDQGRLELRKALQDAAFLSWREFSVELDTSSCPYRPRRSMTSSSWTHRVVKQSKTSSNVLAWIRPKDQKFGSRFPGMPRFRFMTSSLSFGIQKNPD